MQLALNNAIMQTQPEPGILLNNEVPPYGAADGTSSKSSESLIDSGVKPVYQPPPLPPRLQAKTTNHNLQRLTTSAEADGYGPYKLVPLPKAVSSSEVTLSPPPYRQPPSLSQQESMASAAAATIGNNSLHLHNRYQQPPQGASVAAVTSEIQLPGFVPTETGPEGLRAYSSKFPIERELIVSTADKIAEVGRISHPELSASSGDSAGAQASHTTMNPTGGATMMTTGVSSQQLARRLPHLGSYGRLIQHQKHQVKSQSGREPQQAWTEDRKLPVHKAETMPLVPQHRTYEGVDNPALDELQRPAAYLPMHYQANGWQDSNSYVPMHYSSGTVSEQPPPNPYVDYVDRSYLQNPHLAQYEVRVDDPKPQVPSSSISSHRTVGPGAVSSNWTDTPTVASEGLANNSDQLRDTCNKLFVRDGQLRRSAQLALSPVLSRTQGSVRNTETGNMNNGSTTKKESLREDEVLSKDINSNGKELDGNNKSGSLSKKLAGKTYHHIKDIFSNRFKSQSQQQQPANSAPTKKEELEMESPPAVASSSSPSPDENEDNEANTEYDTSEPNLRRSQPTTSSKNGHEWGSYATAATSRAYQEGSQHNSSLSDVDSNALAKLTLAEAKNAHLNKTQARGQPPIMKSPNSVRHPRPSVTFNIELNEPQAPLADNNNRSYYDRANQQRGTGQVILYDDSMHFPPTNSAQQMLNQSQTSSQDISTSYDNSESYLPSPRHQDPPSAAYGRNPYGNYDIPNNNKAITNDALYDYSLNQDGTSSGHHSAGSSSDFEKRSGQSVSTIDSGIATRNGNVQGVSGSNNRGYGGALDSSIESDKHHDVNESSEWTDVVDPEFQQAIETQQNRIFGNRMTRQGQTTGTSSDAHQINNEERSLTPPLPPLSPENSPMNSPKVVSKYNTSKPDLLEPSSGNGGGGGGNSRNVRHNFSRGDNNGVSGENRKTANALAKQSQGGTKRSNGNNADKKTRANKESNLLKTKYSSKSTNAMHSLVALQEMLDAGEITSTTTGLDLDLDSLLERESDSGSLSHSEDDLNTTLDMGETRALRRQLEGLETMYSKVLKALAHKRPNISSTGFSNSELKLSRRRMHGSVSSLPSSISSRPVYRDKRRYDDRKRIKELKSTSKRFLRLESHVVTLARSVAHLSSEMRTQHLMIQEMENIRSEIAQLRTQPIRPQASFSAAKGYHGHRADLNSWQGAVPSLTNPSRVKKLTSFFGDEPPLLRIFLKKLGYEKYAALFEQERVGLIELPYLTEDRLQKMGIPMGPRLRILQEAQLSCRQENFNVYMI